MANEPHSETEDLPSETNCEQAESRRRSLVEELENYRNEHVITAANRDGDLFYVECPECGSLDLNIRRFVACRNCHTFFSLYFEDGMKRIDVENDFSSISAHGENLKLISLDSQDHVKKILYGRNKNRLGELKEKYPDAKVMTLYRDFNPKTKMDGHNHHQYRRFAIIPLD